MAELSLKKANLQEKRLKAEKQSKMLLDNTLKAISRFTSLKRTLSQLEKKAVPREGTLMQWQTNLNMMNSKERQYLQQLANFKDKALAELAIEKKRRGYEAAEKYLEDALHSAPNTLND